MTEQEAMQHMREQADRARQIAAQGDLTRYLAGWFEGKIDAFAEAINTDAVRQLRDQLDAELSVLPRRGA